MRPSSDMPCSCHTFSDGDMQVIKWVTRYQQEVRIKLNIEEEDLAFPAGPGSGTWLMTEKYISRVESILVAWFTNILEVIL